MLLWIVKVLTHLDSTAEIRPLKLSCVLQGLRNVLAKIRLNFTKTSYRLLLSSLYYLMFSDGFLLCICLLYDDDLIFPVLFEVLLVGLIGF